MLAQSAVKAASDLLERYPYAIPDPASATLAGIAAQFSNVTFPYTSRDGDTLASLATEFDALPEAIQAANPGVDFAPLVAGTPLTIPVQVFVEYVTRRGDTFASVADQFGTTAAAVEAANPGVDPALPPGTRLRLAVEVTPHTIVAANATVPNLLRPWAAGNGLVAQAGQPQQPSLRGVTYQVSEGDTLAGDATTGIAQRFGTDATALLNDNLDVAGLFRTGAAIGFGTIAYAARNGDTLQTIATYFGFTPQALLAANSAPEIVLQKGQTLVIPGQTTAYTVQPNDTLEAIAKAQSTTTEQLLDPQPRDPGAAGGERHAAQCRARRQGHVHGVLRDDRRRHARLDRDRFLRHGRRRAHRAHPDREPDRHVPRPGRDGDRVPVRRDAGQPAALLRRAPRDAAVRGERRRSQAARAARRAGDPAGRAGDHRDRHAGRPGAALQPHPGRPGRSARPGHGLVPRREQDRRRAAADDPVRAGHRHRRPRRADRRLGQGQPVGRDGLALPAQRLAHSRPAGPGIPKEPAGPRPRDLPAAGADRARVRRADGRRGLRAHADELRRRGLADRSIRRPARAAVGRRAAADRRLRQDRVRAGRAPLRAPRAVGRGARPAGAADRAPLAGRRAAGSRHVGLDRGRADAVAAARRAADLGRARRAERRALRAGRRHARPDRRLDHRRGERRALGHHGRRHDRQDSRQRHRRGQPGRHVPRARGRPARHRTAAGGDEAARERHGDAVPALPAQPDRRQRQRLRVGRVRRERPARRGGAAQDEPLDAQQRHA